MSNSTEMEDLSRLHAGKSTSADSALEDDAGTGQRTSSSPDDGSISVWAWTSAGVFVAVIRFPRNRCVLTRRHRRSLALFSTCLLAFPRFLLFLTEPPGGRGTLTRLEKYLTLQLGIILGTLAITIIAMVRSIES